MVKEPFPQLMVPPVLVMPPAVRVGEVPVLWKVSPSPSVKLLMVVLLASNVTLSVPVSH